MKYHIGQKAWVMDTDNEPTQVIITACLGETADGNKVYQFDYAPPFFGHAGAAENDIFETKESLLEGIRNRNQKLLSISFSDAQCLSRADKEQWAKLHNKGANLYTVNMEGELMEVPAQGWWY